VQPDLSKINNVTLRYIFLGDFPSRARGYCHHDIILCKNTALPAIQVFFVSTFAKQYTYSTVAGSAQNTAILKPSGTLTMNSSLATTASIGISWLMAL